MHAPLIPALLAALAATTAGTALAAPDHACRQVGQIQAAPPLIPQGFRIDECSSFAGGAEGLRKTCEGRKRKNPGAVFTVL